MNTCVEKAKMEIDDVVDLSLGFNRDSITAATVRDLRSLTQNTELTITPASTQLYSSELQHSSHQSSQEHQNDDQKVQRRVLRPRTEPKSYAEAPDIVLLPARTNGRQHNGNIDSETDDEEMPLCFPIKELSPAELKERERSLRKLRDDLRNEETKLVLLKKLKQSQHVMKENLVVTSTCTSATSPFSPTPELNSSKGLPHPLPTTCAPYLTNTKTRSIVNNHRNLPPVCTRANEAILPPPRSSLPGGATLTAGRSVSFTRTSSNLTITPSVTITPTSGIKQRNLNISDNSKLPGAMSSSAVTSGPASAQQNIDTKSERSLTKEEVLQSPAQKQAAAKLALRKQLEKTLLQIPPPKPPPPEMHFVPNPSNSEFVYLLGLETVVDYLMTKEKHISTVLPAFCCVQCKTDFTPVWKWEKQGNKDAKVICEQCVTTNVKKALKVEHTNRLKQAFVKALQQEQEIEQRLSTQNRQSPVDSLASNLTTSVLPSSVIMSTKCQRSQTPTTRPTPPPSNQPTPPPIPPATQRPLRQHHETRPNTPTSNHINQHIQVQQHKQQISFEKYSSTAAAASAAQLNALSNAANLNSVSNLGNLGHNLGNIGNLGNITNLGNIINLGILGNSASSASSTATAAAMQAFHQQIFRVLGQGLANNPQHIMQFTPLLYSYHQMALAQAAQVAAGKNSPSLADIQRAAEMQRQFLLDMIPPQAPGPSNNRQNNWKN